jgi:hypothetical protein
MYMLERWPRPLLIGESGEQQLLQAAAVGKPPFSERELQVILARHPQRRPRLGGRAHQCAPRAVCEAALAHVVTEETEAYFRSHCSSSGDRP